MKLPFTQESQERLAKLQKLSAAGIICYADKFIKSHSCANIKKEQCSNQADELLNTGAQDKYSIAGRLMLFRSHGKLSFARIQDAQDQIQICFVKDKLHINTGQQILTELVIGEEKISAYKFIEKYIDIGDFMGVSGELFLTKHGETTLFVNTVQLLAKAIRPLPEKFHGLENIEIMYRQRYLDLIMNGDTYERFKFKSKFIQHLREFYWENGFTELDTPVLGHSASGAAANPFVTHHDDFDLDMFLRISPETQLKKATVGRFERVFEIARDFRNEGSDPSHHQEFIMVEHYAVYWNYEDNMIFAEQMIDYLFDKLNLPRKIKIKNKDNIEKEVDFTTPWVRINYIDQIKQDSGIDVSQYTNQDEEQFRILLQSKKLDISGIETMSLTTMIDHLFKKLSRPHILGPAIVYNYPKIMQPLARISDSNPQIVEQFQLIINGWEIMKAYSELVNPLQQSANFEIQAQAQARGDNEATSSDDEFVLAMEYGMPPQSGLGFGIDRFLALITLQENIRDAILFPMVKPL